MGDAVSSGLSARNAFKQLEMARALNAITVQKTGSEAALADQHNIESGARQQLIERQARGVELDNALKLAVQPFNIRKLASEALLSEYTQPGAKAQAEYDRMMGKISPAIGTAAKTAGILGALGLGGFGVARLFRRGKAVPIGKGPGEYPPGR